MAACVAVISNLNHLLYICTASCPDPLFYHFKAHSALDVIEDKLYKSNHGGNQDQQQEQYLGLLYPMEDHRLYGYVTNTKVKFVMVFESYTQILPSSLTHQVSMTSNISSSSSSNTNVTSPTPNNSITNNSQSSMSSLGNTNPHRDFEIRNMFNQLHKAYVDLVSSPFYKINTPIDPDKMGAAKRFDQFVTQNLLAKQASSGYCTTLTSIIDQA